MNTDVQNQEIRLQEAQDLVQQYIQLIAEKDLEGWTNLWNEQCVLELPFAPQGRPQQVEGKTALFRYVQEVRKNIEIISISRRQVYLTHDPNLIIAEIAGEGRILSTGRNYRAVYVWIMRIHEGKLSHIRDYWNPLASQEAREELETAKPGSKEFEQEYSRHSH